MIVVRPPTRPEDVTGLPAEVALVHAFLNTLDERSYRVHGHHLEPGDQLDSCASLEAWLLEHHLLEEPLAPVRTRAQRETLALALGLRSSLREAVEASADGPSTAALEEFPLVPCLGGDGVSLRVAAPRSPQVVAQVHSALGRVVITSVELSATGSWKRLRMCPAPDCRWIFYDRSRPGKARWCSPSLCGNRYKLRRTRAKDPSGSQRPEASLAAGAASAVVGRAVVADTHHPSEGRPS
jgi:predicted RNA-binding Zn ribbon-like protein